MHFQFQKFYSNQFNSGDKSFMCHLEIKSNQKEDVSDQDKIQKVISNIIKEKEPEELQGKTITVKFNENKTVVWISGETKAVTILNKNLQNVQAVSMKIVNLENPLLPKRTRTFSEIFQALLNKWPIDRPIVKFLWAAIAVPAAAVQKLIHPGKIYDMSALTWTQDPQGKRSVEGAMQEVVEVLGSETGMQAQQAVSCFKQGLHFAKSWREGSKQSAVDQMCTQLMTNNQIGDIPSDKDSATTLAVIPGGHWKKGRFEPSLWSFYRTPEGKVRVLEMGYGQQTGSKVREFEFEQLDEEKIKRLLQNLMLFAEEPLEGKALSKKEIIGAAYVLGTQLTFDQEKDPMGAIPGVGKGTKSIVEYKESLFIEAGGKPLATEKTQTTSEILTADPLKLVHETLRTEFPEASLKDKALFSLHIFNNRLSKVLKALPHMQKKERSFWLHKLNTDHASLVSQLEKSATAPEVLHAFTTLQSNIEALKGEVKQLESEELSSQKKRLNKLDNVPQSKFQLKVSKKAIQKIEKNEKAGSERLSLEDLKNIEELGVAFEGKEITSVPIVVEKLQALTNRVDEFVAAGHFNTAIELSRRMMPLIPSPSEIQENVEDIAEIAPTGFWQLLVQAGNSDDVKLISDQIGKMTQYFWEAKVKTADLPLKPDEWVFMLNQEAALHQMIQVRKKILTLKEKGSLTHEEKSFLVMAEIYGNDSRYGKSYLEKFRKEKHLRPCENPQLFEKFEKIEAYLNKVKITGTSNSYEFARANNEQGFCKAVLKHFSAEKKQGGAGIENGEAEEAMTHKQMKELWHSYLDRLDPPDPTKVQIPSQFGDLSRHQLMFTSMLYPITSIGSNRIWVVLKNYLSTIKDLPLKVRRELQKERFLESIQVIKGYDRLEISPQMTEGFFTSNWRIVPKGHPIGKKATIGISSHGMIRSQEVITEVKPESIHAKALGDPSALFGSYFKGDLDSSEASLLSKALASDSPAPFDDYLLNVLKGVDKGEIPNFTPETVHEVFDALLHRPWLLERLQKNDLQVEGLEAQRRLYEVLFTSGLIEKALKKNPEFFISHAPHLKTLLNRCLEQKAKTAYPFLLYLTQTVHHHAQLALNKIEDGLLKDKFNEIIRVWPHGTTSTGEKNETYQDAAFRMWESEDSTFQQKVDGAALSISLFSNHPDAWKAAGPSGLTEESGKTISHLLKMGSLLEMAKGEATIPIIAEQGIDWIKEHVVPYIHKIKEEPRNKLIDQWLEQQQGKAMKPGPWEPVEGQPQVWRKLEGIPTKDGGIVQQETVVDLSILQIVKFRGQPIKGIEVEIPEEIRQNPDYITAFGKETFSAYVAPGSIGGQFIYEFTDQKGTHFRIATNKSDLSLNITQKEVVTKNGKTKNVWWQLTRPEFPKPKESVLQKFTQFGPEKKPMQGLGIEKKLMKHGVWMNRDNPKIGRVFFGKTVTKTESKEEFRFSLTPKGGIKSLKTGGGMEVVHDPEKKLSPVLSCLPPEQILFLKKRGSSAITQIRFIGQKVYLERSSPKGPWMVKGDDHLEGAEWVVGKERGAAPAALLKSLGTSIEQTGFTVRKGENLHFLTWPQPMGAKASSIEQLSPPLNITINEKGNIVSSSGGYLHLAYLFAAKHEYAQSALYLQRAREAKIETKEELNLLAQMENNFKQLPVTSARSALVKLKSLLAVRQVFQEQTKIKQYQTEQWKLFLASAEEIQDVYSIYQKQMEKSPFAKEKTHFNEENGAAELTLTANELNELNHNARESFSFLLSENKRAATVIPEQMKLSISVPTQNEINTSFPFLLIEMAKPLKNPERLLENLSLSPSCVVNHFFELYNLIIQHKISPAQLQPLFAPIPGMENNDSIAPINNGDSKSPELMEMGNLVKIDLARRLLLYAAEDTKLRPVDLNRLLKLKKQVPRSIVSSLSAAVRLGRIANKLTKTTETEKIELLEKSKDARFTKELKEIKKIFEPPLDKQGKTLTTTGIEEAPADDLAIKAMVQKGNQIDLEKFQKAIKKDPDLFGPTATPILLHMLARDEVMQEFTEFEGTSVPLEKLIEVIEQKTRINLMEALREAEVKKRISELESNIPENKTRIDFTQKDEKVCLKEIVSPDIGSFKNLFSVVKEKSVIGNLNAMKAQFIDVLNQTNDKDPVGNTARKDLLKGIEEASNNILQPKIASRRTLSTENLDNLSREIATHKDYCTSQMNEVRTSLLTHLKKHEKDLTLPKELRKALKYAEKYGEEGILHILKQTYQTMELKDGEAATLLSKYLLFKAAAGVLSGPVEDQIKTLQILKEQGAGTDSNDWISAVTRVHDLTTQALNLNRYLDDDGYLLNASLHRKILIAEASQGIILTNEQIELIKKMASNPCDWYELKVGLGKTSIVFPIVLMLLIEQGEFPVAMVKDELMEQNLDSLDRATRDLLEKAGVEFSFRLNDPITPVMLQEQFLRLLEVQSRKGYPITSISSLIAIDQKLQLLNEELQAKLILFNNGPLKESLVKGSSTLGIDSLLKNEGGFEELKSHLAALKEIEDLQKNSDYLAKIKEKLELVIIDEADDIQNVICENNVGRGEPVQLNAVIQNTMSHLLRVLLKAAEPPELMELKNALNNGTQASISSEKIKKNTLPALVKIMLQDELFLKEAKLSANEFNLEGMVDHLCKVFEDSQSAPKITEFGHETSHVLGALKHIVQVSLPIALMQKPGIDAGVKKSDGYQIGPHISGREKQGTVFSDEHDLLVNHYLYYGIHLPEPLSNQKPEESFTMKGLKQIRDKSPLIYKDWVDKSEKAQTSVIEYLNAKENFSERLQFLNLLLIEEQKIKRFEKQIVFNVQDICYGRRVGGMTGTLNRDCLPDIKKDGGTIDRAKKVTAQVLLEAGILKVPKVTSVEESTILDAMQESVKDLNNKCIINQGFYLENGDALAVVKQLRTAAQERTFVFVDTDSRKTYIWKSGGNEQPELISKQELNALALNQGFKENACFYFAPPDTRGTDFRIPPGNGVTFLSPRCSMDDFVQTLGRQRGAGHIHSMDVVIPQGVANRIKERTQEEPNFASIVNDIVQQDVQELQGKNLKAAIQGMKTVVQMGSREILYGHQKALDDHEYWDPKTPAIKFLNTFFSTELAKIVNDPETGWLIQKNTVDLERDFASSILENTAENLTKIYEGEVEKIKQLKEGINTLSLQAMGLQFVQQFATPEFNKSKVNEWIQTRINELQHTVNEMETNLENAYAKTITKLLDEDNQIYPEKVPSSGAGIPTAQAQVQEVQQQQQQQQQQEQQQQQQSQSMGSSKLINAWDYTFTDKLRFFDKSQKNSSDSEIKILKFFTELDIHLSKNFKEIFKLAGGVKGNLSLCRLAVDHENQVCLVTRQDSHNLKENNWKALYTLMNPQIYGESFVLNSQNIDGCEDPLKNKEVLKAAVQAKWFVGISEYTNEEKKLLREWLKAIREIEGHNLFLNQYGTQQQKELYSKLAA